VTHDDLIANCHVLVHQSRATTAEVKQRLALTRELINTARDRITRTERILDRVTPGTCARANGRLRTRRPL